MTFSHGAAMAFDRVSRAGSIPALILALLLFLGSATPSAAITLLRDADIEHGLTELALPVLRAAGLNHRRVRVLVVDDSSLNAFVIDGRAIFLHSGLIEKTRSAATLQAVIAHEAAHIANGHIARRMNNFRAAQQVSGLGLALAVLAAAAGGGDAAAGIALGTSSSARRSFLAHTRAEESAADRSAASFLRLADISPRALVELHDMFRGQELLSVGRQDPYMQSHPLTRDRMRAAEAFVVAFGDTSQPHPNADYWFARVQGKLTAHTRPPKWTMRRATSEQYGDIRHMREAVAFGRLNDLGRATGAIDAAIALRPDDPFYYDLKGEILLKNRQVSRAVQAYEQAVALAPTNPMILGGYGRALLAAGKPETALEPLEKSRARDYRDARVMRDLASAYAEIGKTGMAAMVTAERHALEGRMADAGRQARRAVGLLPRGSAAWQRAEDVLIAAQQFEKRKKRK